MCGIVGFLDRTGADSCAVGQTTLNMLNALACRGPDSAGMALYGQPWYGRLTVRVKIGESGNLEPKAQQVIEATQPLGAGEFSTTGSYLRFRVDGNTNVQRLGLLIESLDPDFEVVSVGRTLEVIKQVGSPANLENTYQVSSFLGTHALGHTRLSTESRVDLSHSQPFWGHGSADLAIVHNGHITNYHQLRRRYEQRDVRFYTENDSEIIAVYIAEQLAAGRTLKDSLEGMLRDLDGSFSCVAATASEVGFVKDPFALKPLLFAETPEFVAMATEEIAIRTAIPGDYRVNEAGVREVRVWAR